MRMPGNPTELAPATPGPFPPPAALPAGNFQQLRVRWGGERCCVCDQEGDYDYDQLVTCDLCGVAVHQVRAGASRQPASCERYSWAQAGLQFAVALPLLHCC